LDKKVKLIIIGSAAVTGIAILLLAQSFLARESLYREFKKVEMDLRQRNISLSERLNSVDKEKEWFRQKAEAVERQLNQLSQEYVQLRAKYQQMLTEKDELLNRIQKLTEEKQDLQKRVEHLQEQIRLSQADKENLERQLRQAQGLLRSKEELITQAKADLSNITQKVGNREKQVRLDAPNSELASSIELPPIVVKSDLGGHVASPRDTPRQSSTAGPIPFARQGRIISVNEENNFVIINLGLKDGVTKGTQLTVFRDTKEIGKVEVIELREEIAACDIVEISDWQEIKAGDVVVGF
jgi:predicted nuclease with TOPRIM domain